MVTAMQNENRNHSSHTQSPHPNRYSSIILQIDENKLINLLLRALF